MAKDETPIVMGAPDWIVTYGDMMSLLLTFFILLFAMSEVKQDKMDQIQTSINEWVGLDPTEYPSLDPENVQGSELESVRDSTMGEKREGGLADNITVEDMKKEIQTLRELPPVVVTTGSFLLFTEDSADLLPASLLHVKDVALLIKGYPGQRVEIIGHVSPKPISPDAKFKDSIELGYHRARVVRDLLVTRHNLKPEQFKIVSVGTYYPPDPATWLQKDLSSNDRVEIIVTKVPLPPRPAQKVGYNLSGSR